MITAMLLVGAFGAGIVTMAIGAAGERTPEHRGFALVFCLASICACIAMAYAAGGVQ